MFFANAVLSLVLASGIHETCAVTIGQVSDFEDGTVQGWIWGRSGFGGPELQNGGPDGATDVYLQTESFGGDDAPGSRMALIQRGDWTGDFVGGGIGAIRLDASNLGPNFAFEDMVLRLAFSSTTASQGSGRVVTSMGFPLARDSGWQQLEFSLDPSDLSPIAGSDVMQVMSSVSEMRILSSTEPAFIGDQFAARLGLDNITAMPVPEPAFPIALIVALAMNVSRRSKIRTAQKADMM